jgi:hypothetical protein
MSMAPRYVVDSAGTTVLLWPFIPNWSSPPQVVQEYRTDIFRSRSGREQRRAQRSTPRKSVEYRFLIHQDSMRSFDRTMRKWQNKPVVIGDPTRKTLTSAALPSGATTVTLRDVPSWIAVGEELWLYDGADMALAVVGAIEPLNTITFTAPAARNWPAWTVVRPRLKGQISASMRATFGTNALAAVEFRIDVDPGSERLFADDEVVDVLNGREVLARKGNWGESRPVTYNWGTEDVDFGYGRVARFRPILQPSQVTQITYVTEGAGDTLKLDSFFWRNKGQQGEFYLPSDRNDLPIAAPIVAGNSNIRVAGTEVFDTYNDDEIYTSIAIFLRDGRRLYRRIVDMFVDGGDTVLQTHDNFLVTIDPSEVSRISWMTVCRFASDQFTQEWLTDRVMQTQLSFQTLPDLPVERPVMPELDGAAKWVLEVWGAEAGGKIMDSTDYMVNIAYPATHYIPEAWVFWQTTQAAIDSLDYLINVRYPEITQ